MPIDSIAPRSSSFPDTAFEPACSTRPGVSQETGGSTELETLDVLVVDDEPEVLAVLRRLMQRKGFTAQVAGDAEAAAETLSRVRPRVILLDLMMPKIDGAAFLRELRKTYSPGSLPVIVVTASNQREDMLRCLDAGANDFVNKPVDMQALLARVELQLAISDRFRALEAQNGLSTPPARPAWEHGAADLLRRIEDVRAEGAPVSALLFEVDCFEELTLAHEIVRGEDALQVYASAVRRAVDSIGDFYRCGPTEFAVVARSGTGPGELRALAREVATGRQFGVQIGACAVNRIFCAVGVMLGAVGDAKEILQGLRLARRAAAEAGRGRVFEYSAALRDARLRAVRIESEIEAAIEREDVIAHFEPIIGLGSNHWVGLEAHPVWGNEALGAVQLHEIVSAADAQGVGLELFEALARDSFRVWRTLADPDLFVAINAPESAVGDPRLTERIAAVAQQERFDLGALVVEIGESALTRNFGAATATLEALSKLGVRTAIDEFGSSCVSLGYLCRLPAGILKVDGGMLAAAHERPDARTLLGTLCRMAKHQGKTVVLTGADRFDSSEIAREVGADLMQGVPGARVLSAEETRSIIAALNAP